MYLYIQVLLDFVRCLYVYIFMYLYIYMNTTVYFGKLKAGQIA